MTYAKSITTHVASTLYIEGVSVRQQQYRYNANTCDNMQSFLCYHWYLRVSVIVVSNVHVYVSVHNNNDYVSTLLI